MRVGAEYRQDLHRHRSGAGSDFRQVRRYRQVEGTDSARVGGAGTVFPQWLGRNSVGCGEFLQSALQHRPHRRADERLGRVPANSIVASASATIEPSTATLIESSAGIGMFQL